GDLDGRSTEPSSRGGHEHTGDLLDEQRYAVGVAHDLLEQRVRHRLTSNERAGDHLLDVRAVEPHQLDQGRVLERPGGAELRPGAAGPPGPPRHTGPRASRRSGRGGATRARGATSRCRARPPGESPRPAPPGPAPRPRAAAGTPGRGPPGASRGPRRPSRARGGDPRRSGGRGGSGPSPPTAAAARTAPP